MKRPADGSRRNYSLGRKISLKSGKGYRINTISRKCDTCHWYDKTGPTPCIDQKCMFNRKHQYWEPQQNGDKLRQMSNYEIADLLDGSVIDKESFLEWLDSEVEDNEY